MQSKCELDMISHLDAMGTWKSRQGEMWHIWSKKAYLTFDFDLWPLYTYMQSIAIVLSYLHTKYELDRLRHWKDMNRQKKCIPIVDGHTTDDTQTDEHEDITPPFRWAKKRRKKKLWKIRKRSTSHLKTSIWSLELCKCPWKPTNFTETC